jgi:hypothetical protein
LLFVSQSKKIPRARPWVRRPVVKSELVNTENIGIAINEAPTQDGYVLVELFTILKINPIKTGIYYYAKTTQLSVSCP